MNLGELKRMLSESFMRPDLAHNYADWINRGLRKIQEDEDWGAMKERLVVQINSGSSSVALPERFKSLTAQRHPVHVRTPGETEAFPCDMTTFEQSKAYRATTFFPPLTATQYAARSGVPVYLDQDGESFHLSLTAPAAENLEFLVSCYMFAPDLAADSDSSFLTRQYPDMVESRVKAISFNRVNDLEMAAAMESAYRGFLKEARADDFRRYRQGRPLRMGG